MNVRPATPADVATMRSMEARAASAAHWTEQEYQRLFTPDPPRLSLVVEDGSVQGFLVGKQIGTEWEIENIVVAENSRRRGLGSMLLAHFLELIRRQNAESVFLEVRASNAAARALYAKSSFLETGRRPGYYASPPEDAILYCKVLGE